MTPKRAMSTAILGTCLVIGPAVRYAAADYADTITSYGPVGYWRLSESARRSYTLESDELALDTSYNIAFTFGSEGMRLYVDGVLVDSDAYTGGLAPSSGGIGNYEPLVFGASTWVSGNRMAYPLREFHSGLIDEVAIFGQELGSEDINAMHQVRIPEPGSLVLLTAAGGLALAHRRRA